MPYVCSSCRIADSCIVGVTHCLQSHISHHSRLSTRSECVPAQSDACHSRCLVACHVCICISPALGCIDKVRACQSVDLDHKLLYTLTPNYDNSPTGGRPIPLYIEVHLSHRLLTFVHWRNKTRLSVAVPPCSYGCWESVLGQVERTCVPAC